MFPIYTSIVDKLSLWGSRVMGLIRIGMLIPTCLQQHGQQQLLTILKYHSTAAETKDTLPQLNGRKEALPKLFSNVYMPCGTCTAKLTYIQIIRI